MRWTIFLLLVDQSASVATIDAKEANSFLKRVRRHNSMRGEEGTAFNVDDNLERECLEEKCSNGEIHEVYENDQNPQFDRKSYNSAKEYLERIRPGEKHCDEHINIDDREHRVDGLYYMVHDYSIQNVNIYLKSLVYQHANVPNLALILCMDNAEGICKWRFVNTENEKCSKRCYSGRAEFEYCPARDLSNFEHPYNNRNQLILRPVLYQISRSKCWMPRGKQHFGCKCDLNGRKICERNLLQYSTIWNRCDHNCKSDPDCDNHKFAYCCARDSEMQSCPAKMKAVAGPSHKYIYPVYWSEWAECSDGYDCRTCINAEHNNRKCGDTIRRRTRGRWDGDDVHTMRSMDGAYPLHMHSTANLNPAAYIVPVVVLLAVIFITVYLVLRKQRKRKEKSSIREQVFNIPAAFSSPHTTMRPGYPTPGYNTHPRLGGNVSTDTMIHVKKSGVAQKAKWNGQLQAYEMEDISQDPKPKPRKNGLSKNDISLPVTSNWRAKH